MIDELLYTQEEIDEWMRTCEELQEKITELEQARKETAREIFKGLKVKLKGYIGLNYLDEIAKQYGVEVEE